MAQMMALASRSSVWEEGSEREVWSGRRDVHLKWRIRVGEVEL